MDAMKKMTPQALGTESVEPLGNADLVYPATDQGQFAQQPVGAGSEQRGHTYGAAGDSAIGTGMQKTAHQESHVRTAECVDVRVGAPQHVDTRHEFDSSPGAQIDADVTSVKTTTAAKSPAVQGDSDDMQQPSIVDKVKSKLGM